MDNFTGKWTILLENGQFYWKNDNLTEEICITTLALDVCLGTSQILQV
jgi:hypothetical protein